MSELRFLTFDVFTDRPYGGNPLAVVFGGDHLDGAQMQRIAREFNLSETVFVLQATVSGAMLRLRIFTPAEELPFAGHPIVGAACSLVTMEMAPPGSTLNISIETGSGLVPVILRNDGRVAYAELTAPQLPRFEGQTPETSAIADVLGLEARDLGFGGEAPCIASCGLPMLLVPLRAPELLAGIDTDRSRVGALLADSGARGLYVYARGYEGELRTRMFHPSIGEDPATGSAAAALAGRLANDATETDSRFAWNLVQGAEMGRPSAIFASADKSNGTVTAVRVGGHAVHIMKGYLNAD